MFIVRLVAYKKVCAVTDGGKVRPPPPPIDPDDTSTAETLSETGND
jgi:hypothetical protein